MLTLPNFLLLFGLFGLLATARWYTTGAYRGDQLVNYTCTINEPPKFMGSGKQDRRYAFHVKEFFAEFWLVGTAIGEYNRSSSEKYKIEPGDTVKLAIQESSIALLNNPLNHIYVWSFMHNNRPLVDASAIQQQNKKNAYLLFTISGVTALLGVITAIRRRFKIVK